MAATNSTLVVKGGIISEGGITSGGVVSGNASGLTNFTIVNSSVLFTNAAVSNSDFTNYASVTLTGPANWLITAKAMVARNGATFTSSVFGVGIGTQVNGGDLSDAGNQYFYNTILTTDTFKSACVPDYLVTVTTATTNYYCMIRLDGYSVAVPNIWSQIIAKKQ